MRQRRVKNEKEKVLAYEELLELEVRSSGGKWQSKFEKEQPLYLEIGCGRGQFVNTLAKQNPTNNYIAMEPQGTIILRALEKTRENGYKNLRYIWDFADEIGTFFNEDELDGLYLNFSDPWPKEKHAKRRITHMNFLKQYEPIVKNGGILQFKTDNKPLFDFTLEELEKTNFEIVEQTFDLHQSEYQSGNITTEYEDRFLLVNKKINYCKCILKK